MIESAFFGMGFSFIAEQFRSISQKLRDIDRRLLRTTESSAARCYENSKQNSSYSSRQTIFRKHLAH